MSLKDYVEDNFKEDFTTLQKTLAYNIKRLMVEKEIKYSTFIEKEFQFSSSHWHYILNGTKESNPNLKTLLILSKKLDTDIIELLKNKEIKNEK